MKRVTDDANRRLQKYDDFDERISLLEAETEKNHAVWTKEEKFQDFVLTEFEKIKEEIFKQHTMQQKVIDEVPALTNMCETAHKNVNEVVTKFS